VRRVKYLQESCFFERSRRGEAKKKKKKKKKKKGLKKTETRFRSKTSSRESQ